MSLWIQRRRPVGRMMKRRQQRRGWQVRSCRRLATAATTTACGERRRRQSRSPWSNRARSTEYACCRPRRPRPDSPPPVRRTSPPPSSRVGSPGARPSVHRVPLRRRTATTPAAHGRRSRRRDLPRRRIGPAIDRSTGAGMTLLTGHVISVDTVTAGACAVRRTITAWRTTAQQATGSVRCPPAADGLLRSVSGPAWPRMVRQDPVGGLLRTMATALPRKLCWWTRRRTPKSPPYYVTSGWAGCHATPITCDEDPLLMNVWLNELTSNVLSDITRRRQARSTALK